MATRSTESKSSAIPDFKNIQEETEFWETHDFTDFWDELKPVNPRVARTLAEPLSIRLPESTVQELRVRASRKGLGPTTLARMWIMERMERERKLDASANAT